MATNRNFITYKPTYTPSRKKPSLAYDRLKSYEELLADTEKRLETDRQLKEFADNLERYQQALKQEEEYKAQLEQQQLLEAEREQAKSEAGFFKRAGQTVKDTFLNVFGGGQRALEQGNQGILNISSGIQKSLQDIGIMPRGGSLTPSGNIDNSFIKDRLIGNTSEKMFEKAQGLDVSYWKDLSPRGQEIAYGVMLGVGEMLPSIGFTIASGGAAGPGMIATGLKAFGGASTQALEEGATYGQAFAYGGLNVGVEVATEKIVGSALDKFAGAGKGLINPKKIASSKAVQVGIGILGEGVEEGLAEVVDPIMKRITYDKDAMDHFLTKEHGEEILTSAIIGSLTGAVFESANVVINRKTNADSAEILSKYDDIVMMEQALQQEGRLTQEQANEFSRIKQELEAQMQLKLNKLNPNQRMQLISKFNDSLMFQNYDPFLAGSEVTRTTQALEANQQQINAFNTGAFEVERAKALHETFKKINSNVANLTFDNTLGKDVNGYYNRRTNQIVINPNVENQYTTVLTHELTHSLEGTPTYNELQNYTLDYLRQTGEYQELRNTLEPLYRERGLLDGMTQEEIDAYMNHEIMSKYSERLFTDPESINRLNNQKRSLARKILEWIKEKLGLLTGRLSKQELELKRHLEKIESLYVKALGEVETREDYDRKINNKDKKYMIVGESANIDKTPLYLAQEMEYYNQNMDEIVEKTGWYKSKDGKWKFQISDKNARIINENIFFELSAGDEITLSELLHHPKLYKLYPELKDAIVYRENLDNADAGFSFVEGVMEISIGTHIESTSELRKVLLHEVQHAVQSIEGSPGGTNPTKIGSTTAYNKALGEREAVYTEKTSNLSQKQIRELQKQGVPEFEKDSSTIIKYSLKPYDEKQHKKKQFEIISKLNPMRDDYHVGIRSVNDIKTFSEAINDPESFVWGDFSKEQALEAERKGVIRVYSSKDIVNGNFVSTSYKQALEYAGNNKNHVKSKIVKVNDVAWINGDEGIFAKVDLDNDIKFSLNSKGVELSKEQQEFFKDSKVRDEQGRLLVVYHGTASDFKVFKQTPTVNGKYFGRGYYFTNNRSNAMSFAQRTADTKKALGKPAEAQVKDVYLLMKNPLEINWDSRETEWYPKIRKELELRANAKIGTGRWSEYFSKIFFNDRFNLRPDAKNISEYDGIIIRNVVDGRERGDTYIVFESNQIKETTNLKPTLNDDIRYSVRHSQNKQTIIKSTESYLNQEAQDIMKTDALIYEVSKNKDTVEKARTEIKGKDVQQEIENTIASLEKTFKATKDNEVLVAKAMLLLQEANKQGLNAHINDLATSVSAVLTQMGKTTQAGSIIQRLSPEGRLLTFRKIVELENERIRSRKGEYTNRKRFKTISKERFQQWFNQDLRVIKNRAVDTFLNNHSDINLSKEQISRLKNLTTTSDNFTNNAIDIFKQALPKDLDRANELGTQFATEVLNQQKQLQETYDNQPVVIPEVLVEQMIKAKGEKNIKEVAKKIERVINSQKASNMFEKAMQWRYLAMLANPKTHFRNIIGNATMSLVVDTRNAISRTIQSVFVKNPELRTRTFKKPTAQTVLYVENLANELYQEIQIEESKYIEAKQGKRVFTNKLIETIREFNYLQLEGQDLRVSKARFTKELSEWMTAKNYTVEQMKNDSKIREAGIQFAYQEALKATFRDASKLATLINKIKSHNALGELVGGAIMPFTKTPINIAKRGFEYSPAGLIKNLTYDIYQLNQGKITISQYLDKLSEGFTGTMIALIGLFLAKIGILSGGDDENKKVSNYERALGQQPFSIKIGDKTYTLDWMAPASIPLFTGVAIYEDLIDKNADDEVIWSIAGAISASLDPMTEMSFLQGFNRILSTYDNNKLQGIALASLESYASQFIPTISNQIARLVDDVRRTTSTTGKTSSKKKFTQRSNYMISRIPFLSKQLEPYVNVWGEIEQNSDFVDRLMENTAYPFWISKNKPSFVDDEIMRLYKISGNTSILPGIPNSYYTKDGERIDMTPEEYTEFKIKVGTFSKKQLQEIFTSQFYKDLDDEEKEKVIEKVYSRAREFAKSDMSKEYLVYQALSVNNNQDKLMKYLVELESIQGIKDKEGNTVQGSKKKNIMLYIQSQKLKKEQKHLLLALANYQNTSAKEDVVNFINSLKDLNEEQKQRLLEIYNY